MTENSAFSTLVPSEQVKRVCGKGVPGTGIAYTHTPQQGLGNLKGVLAEA